jgi:hypothetical protein
MVNGKDLEDELKYIDDFFNNLSDEEFEKMLIECGATPIVSSCDNCGYMGNDCDAKKLCNKYKILK